MTELPNVWLSEYNGEWQAGMSDCEYCFVQAASRADALRAIEMILEGMLAKVHKAMEEEK